MSQKVYKTFTSRTQTKCTLFKLSLEGQKLCLSDWKTQFVPRSKHSASVIKTDKLMSYREIIALCSEIYAKHLRTL